MSRPEQMALSLGNQRWKHRAERWADPETRIDPTRFRVERIHRDLGGDFVMTHHYSGSTVAERFTAGLYRGSDLVGVAVFSEGIQPAAKDRYFEGAEDIVELGRLVLLDEVAGNGESWFLSRAFGLLRDAVHRDQGREDGGLGDVAAILSYSDPMKRTTVDGRVIMPGHIGMVYQATSAAYFGLSSPRTEYLTEDGLVVSPRALGKIRRGERNAENAVRWLLDKGAPSPRPGESSRAWALRALHEGPFRRVRHPGKHTYGWKLARRIDLADTLPYPKKQPTSAA